jgi:hypothetical protein
MKEGTFCIFVYTSMRSKLQVQQASLQSLIHSHSLKMLTQMRADGKNWHNTMYQLQHTRSDNTGLADKSHGNCG